MIRIFCRTLDRKAQLLPLAAMAALSTAVLPPAPAAEEATPPAAQAPATSSKEQQRALFDALCHEQDIEPFLAQGMDVNGILFRYGEDPYTPLFLAAAKPLFGECGSDPACGRSSATEYNTRTLRRLLELGADPNVPSHRYYLLTPLMAAAASGSLENVKLLVEAGARVNQAMSSGATALSFAVTNNHLEVARYLISQGADVNVYGGDAHGEPYGRGTSLLHVTAIKRYADMTKLLLQAGANPDVKDVHGRTPVYWAGISTNLTRESNNPKEQARTLEVFFDATRERHPAAPAALPQLTPLMAAAYAGDMPALMKLLGDGAKVNEANADGATALSWAVAGGRADAVRQLLMSGASVKAPAADMYYRAQALRFTLLHSAAMQQREDIVRLLLDALGDAAPAALKAEDAFGLTPGAWLFDCTKWTIDPPGSAATRILYSPPAGLCPTYSKPAPACARLLELLPANIAKRTPSH